MSAKMELSEGPQAQWLHDMQSVTASLSLVSKIVGAHDVSANQLFSLKGIVDLAQTKMREISKSMSNAEIASKSNVNFHLDHYYTGEHESLFPSDGPDVLKWVGFFQARFRSKKIFERFSAGLRSTGIEAKIVAIAWHQFSEFMPYFLCQSCAQLSSNEKRHFAIQTAFEELGMRHADKIHHNMFWNAVVSCGLAHEIECFEDVAVQIAWLKGKLKSSTSDAYILGLLMGLEGPAEENIECIFNSLAYHPAVGKQLAEHEFFVVHRQVEIEHVKLTVANFLRFCKTELDKNEFLLGFDEGVEFWSMFWGSVKYLIKPKHTEALS